jgi:hypothetical protein
LNRQLIETWTVSTLSGEDHSQRVAFLLCVGLSD